MRLFDSVGPNPRVVTLFLAEKGITLPHVTVDIRGAEGLPMFEQRMRCLPEAAAGLKAVAQDGIAWFDAQIAGRPYIVGDRFTLADIMLFAFLDFGRAVGQPFDPKNTHVAAWFDRVSKRPAFQPDA
jgi:glutathione S-transferase